MDTLRVKDRLEAALGAIVTALAPMPVGFGLDRLARSISPTGGGSPSRRGSRRERRADLRLEAYMLGELARHSTLPVPALHVAAPDLLAMDFIETDGGGITPRSSATPPS